MKTVIFIVTVVSLQTILYCCLSGQSKYYFEIRDGESNSIVKDFTVKLSERSKIIIDSSNSILSFEKIKRNDTIKIMNDDYSNSLTLLRDDFNNKRDTISFYLFPSECELIERWESNKKNSNISERKDTVSIKNIELLDSLVFSRFDISIRAFSYYCGRSLCYWGSTYELYLLFSSEDHTTLIATEFKNMKPEISCFFLNNYLENYINKFPVVILEEIENNKGETKNFAVPIKIRP